MKSLLVAALGLLLSACVTRSDAPTLERLALEGPELHPSLATRHLPEVTRLHVDRAVLHGNPIVSTDADFVESIARAGSQGRLGSDGATAALYALYRGENELGFYGLEFGSAADADRREEHLRQIWAKNVSLERARIHRGDQILVVVWTDGVSPECWTAVNAGVKRRLE